MSARLQNRWRRRAAFTLAEVLVAVGISGLIASACMVAFVAFQRCYELSMARSGVRSNVLRALDAMEIDLRNASAVSAGVSGTSNVLPLIITIPQRYSDFETTVAMAGDPSRVAKRVQPTFDPKTGKLTFANNVTVTYALVDGIAGARNLTRTATWTSPTGVNQTASRVIATMPTDTTITFHSPTGGLMTADDLALVASISAQSNSKIGRSSAPIASKSTIFLRTKSLQ